MYYIKVINNQNKQTILTSKAKKIDIIKNIIDIFKMQNINANNIKIFLKYQNNN